MMRTCVLLLNAQNLVLDKPRSEVAAASPKPCLGLALFQTSENPGLGLAEVENPEKTKGLPRSMAGAVYAIASTPIVRGPGVRGWLPFVLAPSGAIVSRQVRSVTCAFNIGRLEKYTERSRSEVLLVRALVDGEEDEVIIFKGFSSSLVRPTAVDPGELVLPPSATIQSVDRIQGPYNPSKIKYIEEGLSWEAFDTLLKEKGL